MRFEPVQARRGHDATKPGCEFLWLPQPCELQVRAKKRALYEVLCNTPVGDDRVRQPVDAALVPSNERGERSGIADQRERDQLGIAWCHGLAQKTGSRVRKVAGIFRDLEDIGIVA